MKYFMFFILTGGVILLSEGALPINYETRYLSNTAQELSCTISSNNCHDCVPQILNKSTYYRNEELEDKRADSLKSNYLSSPELRKVTDTVYTSNNDCGRNTRVEEKSSDFGKNTKSYDNSCYYLNNVDEIKPYSNTKNFDTSPSSNIAYCCDPCLRPCSIISKNPNDYKKKENNSAPNIDKNSNKSDIKIKQKGEKKESGKKIEVYNELVSNGSNRMNYIAGDLGMNGMTHVYGDIVNVNYINDLSRCKFLNEYSDGSPHNLEVCSSRESQRPIRVSTSSDSGSFSNKKSNSKTVKILPESIHSSISTDSFVGDNYMSNNSNRLNTGAKTDSSASCSSISNLYSQNVNSANRCKKCGFSPCDDSYSDNVTSPNYNSERTQRSPNGYKVNGKDLLTEDTLKIKTVIVNNASDESKKRTTQLDDSRLERISHSLNKLSEGVKELSNDIKSVRNFVM